MKALIAVDGLEPSRAALELFIALADPRKVEATTFSVAYSPNAPLGGEIPAVELDEERKAAAHRLAHRARLDLEAASFSAQALTGHGNPPWEILKVLEDKAFDLCVVGAGSRSWLGTRLLGSTSMHVLHAAPKSILLVHEAPRGQRKMRVLVAVDGSDPSRASVREFIDFADPRRCFVDVVSVVDPGPDLVVPAPGVTYSPVILEARDKKVERELMARAHRSVEEASTLLGEHGFETRGNVLSGSPTSSLLKEAENEGAQLVVTGSRGLGTVNRTFLGSVSDATARLTPAAFITHNSRR